MVVPDIYYPVIKSVNDNAELRFSLRSLKNIEHGNVYIVGYKPLWVKNVIHLPYNDIPARDSKGVFQGWKNQKEKLLIFLKKSEAREVLLMNDDIYIIKKMQIVYYKREERLNEILEKFKKTKPPYIVKLTQEKNSVYSNGLSDHVHCPLKRNREMFLSIIDDSFFKSIGSGKDYLNEFQESHNWENRVDLKIYKESTFNKTDFSKVDIFSTSDIVGKSDSFYKKMENLFPEKSIFEK